MNASNKTNRFRRRTCMAGALMAAMATPAAQATVIWSGMLDQSLGLSFASGLDFQADGNVELYLMGKEGKDPGTYDFTGMDFTGTNSFVIDGTDIAQLAAGDAIDASLNFAPGNSYNPFKSATGDGKGPVILQGQWLLEEPGYAGFRFDDAGTTLFGWLEVTVMSESEFILNQWAYEDSGAAINVGATSSGSVPEPSSLALAAAGLAGLGLRRRKRKDDKPV